MARIWERATLILAGNLISSCSYLSTAVLFAPQIFRPSYGPDPCKRICFFWHPSRGWQPTSSGLRKNIQKLWSNFNYESRQGKSFHIWRTSFLGTKLAKILLSCNLNVGLDCYIVSFICNFANYMKYPRKRKLKAVMNSKKFWQSSFFEQLKNFWKSINGQ